MRTDPTTAAADQRLSARRGFTLLEVMLAVAILLLSLTILMGTQTSAIMMTEEADRILVATQLAQDKLSQVRLLVEHEGFQTADVHEEGDFDDFGDEALNLELESLEEYHYEFLVTEVDIALAGGLAGAAGNLTGAMGGSTDSLQQAGLPDLGGLPIGDDFITNAMQPWVREVKVRVWWGDDLDEAEEFGNEVIITTHIIDPNGAMISSPL